MSKRAMRRHHRQRILERNYKLISLRAGRVTRQRYTERGWVRHKNTQARAMMKGSLLPRPFSGCKGCAACNGKREGIRNKHDRMGDFILREQIREFEGGEYDEDMWWM